MNKLHYKIFIHNYKWFIIKQCNDVSIITADYHTIHKKKYETKQQQKKTISQTHEILSLVWANVMRLFHTELNRLMMLAYRRCSL